MHRAALALVLVLAACATPREQCEANATRDLRTLEALIVETRANIARGYAVRIDRVPVTTWEFCFRNGFWSNSCERTVIEERRTPVAIDLATERAKLRSMEADAAARRPAAEAALRACALAHPDKPAAR